MGRIAPDEARDGGAHAASLIVTIEGAGECVRLRKQGDSADFTGVFEGTNN